MKSLRQLFWPSDPFESGVTFGVVATTIIWLIAIVTL